MQDVTDALKNLKNASPAAAHLAEDKRNAVLEKLADLLLARAGDIMAENKKDLALMPKDDPRYDRLELTEQRIAGIAADTRAVAALPSPLGKKISDTTRPNGLHITRVSVPLGVVGVIYESRPNVTVDVFALCFKAGNACALKGGKEAANSNAVLAGIIHDSLKSCGVSPDIMYLLPPDRAAAEVLMNAVEYVDVLIPRGSQNLINAVRDTSRVPVIETGAGIVHTYFDASGDAAKGAKIINNAKTRRVSVCNALDTLVIHESRLPDLPALMADLPKSNVEVFADEQAYKALDGKYPANLLKPATEDSFGCEFLSYKMSIKTVPSLNAALAHIRAHSSRHSEAIVAQDDTAIARFLAEVDAAAVYANAATSFTDGAQFGLGAEIGISTQKLHARGPMGLEALTSYKWVVYGDGQIRE